MSEHTALILLPVPAEIKLTGEKFPVKNLTGYSIAEEFHAVIPELERVFRTLRMEVAAESSGGAFSLSKSDLPAGAWQMNITADGITAAAGDITGAFYAVGALTQMLFAATISGLPGDALDGAEIFDKPRFAVRSFHLDCARHFQEKEFIKRFLHLLSACRLNTFHWHLTDGQGWRYQSKAADRMNGKGELTDGQYTQEDIRQINALAKTLGITIIPEVDVPGHSRRLLANYPELACDPDDPGNEICLGKPESMQFLQAVFGELMELFPDSPVIHIGGDEAATAHWEKCPHCRKAMEEKKCANMRELENLFMVELSRFITAGGRTPIIWGTCSGQTYPDDTMIQVWLDIREPLKIAPNGNKMIYSVHSSLYFDYPANLSEPWETWMFELSEKGVYMTDPYIIWQDKVKDHIIGTEACLWTETIPQHRVFAKLFPRILAYSECAWSLPEKKSFQNFSARRELLEAAGFTDYLKQN